MSLATGYWQSAALGAAVELGVFDALDAGPLDAGETAKRTNSAPAWTASLLDALTGMGLLTKTQGRYALEQSVRPWLSPASGTCMLDALRFNSDLYPLWGQLARGVRQGGPVVPPGAHLGMDPQRTERFVRGMNGRGWALLPAVLPLLDLAGRRLLLDVAAGPGVLSRLLLRQYPSLRVTLFDLPPVLDVTRQLLQGQAAAEHITLHRGNYHEDPLPTGFDAAVYFGALHQESRESAAGVIAKLHQALVPGGVALVGDMMLDADHTQPLFSALFSITMMLTSPRGYVHSARDVITMMSEVGFGDATCLRSPATPYWVVRAVKPA